MKENFERENKATETVSKCSISMENGSKFSGEAHISPYIHNLSASREFCPSK